MTTEEIKEKLILRKDLSFEWCNIADKILASSSLTKSNKGSRLRLKEIRLQILKIEEELGIRINGELDYNKLTELWKL